MGNVKISGVEINTDNITDEEWEALKQARETPKFWTPNNGDEYSYINHEGDIMQFHYADDETDRRVLSIGNGFATEADAEADIEYRKSLQILRNDSKGYWKHQGSGYRYGYWDESYQTIRFGFHNTSSGADAVRFETEEDIEESIKNHAKEWRIVLRVE